MSAAQSVLILSTHHKGLVWGQQCKRFKASADTVSDGACVKVLYEPLSAFPHFPCLMLWF